MRLTTTLREAFVRTAMQDVPQFDYVEQARSIANKKITQILKKNGMDKLDKVRLHATTIFITAPNGNWASTTSISTHGLNTEERVALTNDEALMKLAQKNHEQSKQLDALAIKLTGAINACSTRKQAVEALPEFEKYLPEDKTKALRSVPVIANVVSAFVQAGWPKDQKSITKAHKVAD